MNRTKIPLSSESSNLLFPLLLKLENAKAEHAEERIGLEKQVAQLKDQLNKARHGLQDLASIEKITVEISSVVKLKAWDTCGAILLGTLQFAPYVLKVIKNK